MTVSGNFDAVRSASLGSNVRFPTTASSIVDGDNSHTRR
jgi:hypothetical protein